MKPGKPTSLHPNLPPRALSRDAAAEYIGVSPGTFNKLVSEGRMPVSVRLYGRLLWDRVALDRAFDALANAEIDSDPNPWDEAINDNG
jgi:predicted DNA-binding transcriptional regulator AlpA